MTGFLKLAWSVWKLSVDIHWGSAVFFQFLSVWFKRYVVYVLQFNALPLTSPELGFHWGRQQSGQNMRRSVIIQHFSPAMWVEPLFLAGWMQPALTTIFLRRRRSGFSCLTRVMVTAPCGYTSWQTQEIATCKAQGAAYQVAERLVESLQRRTKRYESLVSVGEDELYRFRLKICWFRYKSSKQQFSSWYHT